MLVNKQSNMNPKYQVKEITSPEYSLCDVSPVLTDKKIFNYIYKPNDDSFLLLYTIIKELQSLPQGEKKVKVMAEIG